MDKDERALKTVNKTKWYIGSERDLHTPLIVMGHMVKSLFLAVRLPRRFVCLLFLFILPYLSQIFKFLINVVP